jgi:YbbR domain-containing protein
MPQTATVDVQIMPGSSSRIMSGVPVQVRNLESGLRGRLTPSAVTVSFRGTESSVKALTAEALDAQVDAIALQPGDHEVQVRVRAGQGLTIESINPETLRLRIGKQ